MAVDKNNKPVAVPESEPETELEIGRYEALRRKELSLILSGRMKPTDSVELKNCLFNSYFVIHYLSNENPTFRSKSSVNYRATFSQRVFFKKTLLRLMMRF